MEKSNLNLLSVLSHVFNVFALALIIWYGAWFISDGRYPDFHYLENYYVDLSQAFLKGQVSLLQQPDPRLASLADTHEAPGSKIPFLWDMSYFRGKYYLYWGPSPVLFFVIYSAIKGQPAPAQVGVLAAYVGIAIVLLAFLYVLRWRFFQRAPVASIGVFLLAACFNTAYAFLLSRPLTYETAILSGQLFLLLGLFFWLLYLVYRKGWPLVLTGLFWGLAVLARYDTVISVLVYTGAALLLFWLSRPVMGRRGDGAPGDAGTRRRRAGRRGDAARNAILLLAPLAVCALALEAYNVVRFGNPFQTGLEYQLTTPVVHYYASQYIKSNLYVYLFHHNPVLPHFPFITISHFKAADLPQWAATANVMQNGKQFDYGFLGLFYAARIFWFEALAALVLAGIWVARRVTSAAGTASRARIGDSPTAPLNAAGTASAGAFAPEASAPLDAAGTAGRASAPLNAAQPEAQQPALQGVAVPVTGEASAAAGNDFALRRVRELSTPDTVAQRPTSLPPELAVDGLRPGSREVDTADRQQIFAMRTTADMLLLAGLLQLVFLLFYYYSAVRFLSDFFLPLVLGGFFLIWQVDHYLHGKGWLRGIFWLGLIFVTLQSVIIAFFSGLNLFPYYFSHHNPALFWQVIHLSERYQHVIYALLIPH